MAAREYLPGTGIHSYLGDTFRLVYAENPGAFLSVGASLPAAVRYSAFTISVGAFVAALLAWAIFSPRLAWLQRMAIAAIGAGGAANLIDRIRYDGAVTDFLNLGIGSLRTGIFNIADGHCNVGAGRSSSHFAPAPTHQVEKWQRQFLPWDSTLILPDLTAFPNITASQIRAFIDAQLERVRSLGYEVDSCLVDLGATAEAVAAQRLDSRSYDCVMFGAGLRAPETLLLLEKLLNLVHARAPRAKLCFNTSPADTAESIQRWI